MARTRRTRKPTDHFKPPEENRPHSMRKKRGSPGSGKSPRKAPAKRTKGTQEKDARKEKRAAAELARDNETLRQIAHLKQAAKNAHFTVGPFVEENIGGVGGCEPGARGDDAGTRGVQRGGARGDQAPLRQNPRGG